MIAQAVKGWSLFISTLFVILAISNYFGSGKVYPVLISISFIIYLIGEIAVFILNYQFDRRKQDLGIDQRELSRLLTREVD